MTRTIEITLPYEVAHTIEIQAAKDDIRLDEAITRLLTVCVADFNRRRMVVNDRQTIADLPADT